MWINDAKCFFLPLFLASSTTSSFLTFVSCYPGISQVSLILYPLLLFASGIHIAWSIGVKLRTRLQWLNELIPFPAIWSSWCLCRVPSKGFLVDSSASTMHAYFVLRASEVWQVSLYCPPLILQGIAAGIGNSNFVRAFKIVSLNSSSTGSMK